MADSASGAAPGASNAPQGLPPSALAGKPGEGGMSPEESAKAALRAASAAARSGDAAGNAAPNAAPNATPNAAPNAAPNARGGAQQGAAGARQGAGQAAGTGEQGSRIQPDDGAGKQAGNTAGNTAAGNTAAGNTAGNPSGNAPGQNPAGAGAPKTAQGIQAPGSNAQPSEPAPQGGSRPAKADSVFTLYGSEAGAKATPDGEPFPIRMRFDQSIRGLNVGASVDFNGIVLGQVDAINMGFDTTKKRFYAMVDANLYPERLGSVYERVREYAIREEGENPAHPGGRLLGSMIKHGLRAQLRTANLLTGQLYVALDVFPNQPAVDFHWDGIGRAEIPTTQGNLDQLQQQITNIVNKIEKIPFDKIGNELNNTLASASRLMNKLDKQVAPEAQAMIKQASKSLNDLSNMLSSDNGVLANSDRAIQELTRAARSLRVLSDFLQANPEALLRGRGDDPVPGRIQTRK
ncbi:hypothetical protein CAL29_10960 [Bordetella genomosp. 10]|uniref:Mce/MlaD domain-containing protein n=1 Tax=Bordetella genomosp. 10 TaxID=1416804 RepID=A0A261SF94_9BORD|nr:hypothetical protein CAL29_10960 [Bordetella genomosp. 10]